MTRGTGPIDSPAVGARKPAVEIAGARRRARDSQPAPAEPHAVDIVEEWGRGSFPASDPPANW